MVLESFVLGRRGSGRNRRPIGRRADHVANHRTGIDRAKPILEQLDGKPRHRSGSPRSDRATCRAGCHCAASTTHCSGASFRLLEATSMNQRILI